MPKTKKSCYLEGQVSYQVMPAPNNPYKVDSWQAHAWFAGWSAARELDVDTQEERHGCKMVTSPSQHRDNGCRLPEAAFNGIGGVGCSLATPSERMPAPTREHVRQLNVMALSTKDSTRALRLDNKINALYARWA